MPERDALRARNQIIRSFFDPVVNLKNKGGMNFTWLCTSGELTCYWNEIERYPYET